MTGGLNRVQVGFIFIPEIQSRVIEPTEDMRATLVDKPSRLISSVPNKANYCQSLDLSYPFPVKAIYSYTADSADLNELTVRKHETLEVTDDFGRWWKARNEAGETGVIPYNYVILL